jgi:hypothetical protein
MKNSSYTIRNRTRDLPTCSTVPQPQGIINKLYTIIRLRYLYTWVTCLIFKAELKAAENEILRRKYLLLLNS